MSRDRGSHGAVRLCLDALLLAQRDSRRASQRRCIPPRTCFKTF